MQQSGAQILINVLLEQGVDRILGIPVAPSCLFMMRYTIAGIGLPII